MSNVNKKPGNFPAGRINVRGVPSGRSQRTEAKNGSGMNRGEVVRASFSKTSNTK